MKKANVTPARAWRTRSVLAVVVAAVAFIGGDLPWAESVDGAIRDACLGLRLRLGVPPPRVIIIEADSTRRLDDPDELERLVSFLEDGGCRLIVLAFPLDVIPESLLVRAERGGRIVFSRSPAALVADAHPEPWARVDWGLLAAPRPDSGVYRSHSTEETVLDRSQRSLEAEAARKVLGRLPDFPRGRYTIAYRGGAGSLPIFALDDELESKLIAEISRGTVAVVGPARAPGEPGLVTPTTFGEASMSVLEFRAQALNTLLLGAPLSTVPSDIRAACILGLSLVTVFVYGALSARASIAVLVAILSILGALSAGLFVGWGIWLPFLPLAVSQVALHAAGVHANADRLSRSVRNYASDISSHLEEQYWPLRLSDRTPPWSLVANMIHQTLDLNKVIFLEARTGDRRIKEILAVNCSLEDIVERRRDYTRAPYADALSLSRPIRVNGFLKATNADEEQYVAPLVYCGELLGFWAMGIDALRASAISDFESILRSYTSRISELLYYARRGDSRAAGGASSGSRNAIDSSDDALQSLAAATRLLEDRLSTLDVLIHRLDAGIMVCDIFGRVLQVNSVLLEILKRDNLAPFEMTALDFILAVSDLDLSRARNLLRRVIVEGAIASFPAVFRSRSTSRFLVTLKPLVEAGARGKKDESRGGLTRSILFEVVDTTATSTVEELKGNLADRLGNQLRGDLATIEIASSLLGSPRVDESNRERLEEIVGSRVTNCVKTLSDCQKYLSAGAGDDDMERFPVDPLAALRRACEELRPTAAKKRIEIEVKQPKFATYVLASTTKLESLFAQILRLLCEDAADDSTILARATEADDVVAFDFSNMGFGIPNEVFQKYIFGDHPVTTEEYQRMKDAASWVGQWGGLLEAMSEVGVGMHFTVHLVKFL